MPFPYIPFRQGTLLIPSGPAHDPARPHLFIIMTDVVSPNDEILLCCICSIDFGVYDNTCELYPGDHTFITHPSFINYWKSKIETAETLRKGISKKLFAQHDLMDDEVFNMVAEGILASDNTPPRIEKFYRYAQASGCT